MDKKIVFSALVVVLVGLAVFLSPYSGDLPRAFVVAQGVPGGIPGQGGPSGWTDDGLIVRLTNIADFVGIGTQNPPAKLTVSGGDVFVSDTGKGVRLKDIDGVGCHRVTVNSSGVLIVTVVDCLTGEPPPPPIGNVYDSFDSYTAGSELAGGNGGAGWTSGWVKTSPGDYVAQSTGCYSGNCVRQADQFNDAIDDRSFGPLISGSGRVHTKINGESSQYIRFCNDVTCVGDNKEKFYLEYSASFNAAYLKAGTSSQSLGTILRNIWTDVEFQFGGNGGVCSFSQVRARLDGGNWSSCINMSNLGNVQSVRLHYNAYTGREWWIDEFIILAD
ncbi:MAG: hypothetical protein HYT03_01010 [Candidatus Harrisonbacteria bacterium]|nr:hypothetical protein [Candidatus Harrisonbacteria bacterium]